MAQDSEAECVEALDAAWQAIDDNIDALWQKAANDHEVKTITNLWNCLSEAHMKLTLERLKAGSLNLKTLSAKLRKTKEEIEASLDGLKLAPEVISLFADATTLATNAMKFVDEAAKAPMRA